jgi:hypothetical protein
MIRRSPDSAPQKLHHIRAEIEGVKRADGSISTSVKEERAALIPLVSRVARSVSMLIVGEP